MDIKNLMLGKNVENVNSFFYTSSVQHSLYRELSS